MLCNRRGGHGVGLVPPFCSDPSGPFRLDGVLVVALGCGVVRVWGLSEKVRVVGCGVVRGAVNLFSLIWLG